MSDLKAAYRALDPAQPATDSSLYVERPGDMLGVLGAELQMRTSPIHVLVGGQRGVGKTTELYRLEAKIAQQTHFCSHFSFESLEGMDRGGWLALIGLFLLNHVNISKRDAYKDRLDVFAERHMKDVDPMEAKLLVSSILKILSKQEKRPLCLLIDGLEKSPPSGVSALLGSIGSLSCSLFTVVPLSLLLSPEYAAAIAEWDRVISLPAISPCAMDGSPDQAGLAVLRSVIQRRAGMDAFQDRALERLIIASGGLHRELLTLAQQACVRASVAGRTRVEEQDAIVVEEDRRLEYSLHLTPQDLEYLLEVDQTKRITGDPRALPLVSRNLIISYHGAWSWFDVNPIVRPLMTSFKAMRKSA